MFRPLEMFVVTTHGFEWRTPTKRLAILAALVNGGTGIWFGIFQVQGWTMPKPLAVVLLVPVGITIVASLVVALIDVVRNAQGLREHRATNVPWVVSEPPGLLDYQPDSVRAQKRLGREFVRLAQDTRSVGEKVARANRQTPRMANRSGVAKQRWANRTARSLNRSAVFIENRLVMLKRLIGEIERNQRGLIASSPPEGLEQIEVTKNFRETLEGGRAASLESASSVDGYREAVEAFSAQNLSRSLRTASDRLGKALDGVVRTLKNYEKVSAGLVRDLDQQLRRAGKNP